MTPKEVRGLFVSSYRFMKETGMSHNNLLNWEKKGYIPIESQFVLEELTKGSLKANWGDAKQVIEGD